MEDFLTKAVCIALTAIFMWLFASFVLAPVMATGSFLNWALMMVGIFAFGYAVQWWENTEDSRREIRDHRSEARYWARYVNWDGPRPLTSKPGATEPTVFETLYMAGKPTPPKTKARKALRAAVDDYHRPLEPPPPESPSRQ